MDENKKNETEMMIKHSFSNKDFNNYIKLDDIIIDKVDLTNIDKKSTSNKKYKIKYKIILNDSINNNDFKSSIIKNNDDDNKYKNVISNNIYDINDLKITNINEEIKAMEQHEKINSNSISDKKDVNYKNINKELKEQLNNLLTEIKNEEHKIIEMR